MNEFKDSKSAKASKEADSQVDPRSRSSMGSDVDSLLDWTNTTSDVDVTSFRHTVIKHDSKKFKYKCDLCDNTCNMYGLAKKHFFQNHKNFTYASKILVDAEFERKIIDSSLTEIRKLLKDSKAETDRNVQTELDELTAKISKEVEKVKSIKEENLEGAPSLERRKQSTLASFTELERVINNIYKIISSVQ